MIKPIKTKSDFNYKIKDNYNKLNKYIWLINLKLKEEFHFDWSDNYIFVNFRENEKYKEKEIIYIYIQ